MNESSKIAFGILLGMALLGTACIGLCQESPVVNIMIDADIAPTHSADDVDVAGTSLIKLINEIDPKKRNVTIFVSGGWQQSTGSEWHHRALWPTMSLPSMEIIPARI